MGATSNKTRSTKSTKTKSPNPRKRQTMISLVRHVHLHNVRLTFDRGCETEMILAANIMLSTDMRASETTPGVTVTQLHDAHTCPCGHPHLDMMVGVAPEDDTPGFVATLIQVLLGPTVLNDDEDGRSDLSTVPPEVTASINEVMIESPDGTREVFTPRGKRPPLPVVRDDVH
jgi:hypothetical protein